MSKSYIKRSTEDVIVDTVVLVSMLIVFIVTFYPFYYSLILSLNNGLDASRGGIFLWPRTFTIENYMTFFTDSRWARGFAVTIVRTLLGTAVTVFSTCLVSYGLSFKELAFRKVYIGIIIFAMYFSGGLIPFYMVLKFVGLLNSFWVYIIPGALNLFFVLVSISFFQAIPRELNESAMLDGAGEFKILLKIILPLSTPLMATIAIFAGVGHWNSWFDSAFFIQNNNLRTLGYLLMEVINKSNIGSNINAASAAAPSSSSVTTLSIQVTAMIIAVAPIICIYPFLQRYFITGLTIGSVKG